MTYHVNTEHLQQRFDRFSASYDANAFLFQEGESRLWHRLSAINLEPCRILDLGCGTGSLSRRLAERFPDAEIVGVDCSAGMLTVAKARCGDLPKVRFHQGFAELLDESLGKFDWVISSAMLPWCDDVLKVFFSVQQVMNENSIFLFSSFGPDMLREVREAWASVDDGAHVFRFLDMHDVGDRLLAVGLKNPVMDVERFSLSYKALDRFFDDLRYTGSTNSLCARNFVSPKKFQEFCKKLKNQTEKNGVFHISMEWVFGYAEYGELNLNRLQESTISVEELLRTIPR